MYRPKVLLSIMIAFLFIADSTHSSKQQQKKIAIGRQCCENDTLFYCLVLHACKQLPWGFLNSSQNKEINFCFACQVQRQLLNPSLTGDGDTLDFFLFKRPDTASLDFRYFPAILSRLRCSLLDSILWPFAAQTCFFSEKQKTWLTIDRIIDAWVDPTCQCHCSPCHFYEDSDSTKIEKCTCRCNRHCSNVTRPSIFLFPCCFVNDSRPLTA